MPTVLATCPTCGNVSLSVDEVTLTLCSVASMSTYSFWCDGCSVYHEKHAPSQIANMLKGGGAKVIFEHIPLEVIELRKGYPLSWDEVLDFTNELSSMENISDQATEEFLAYLPLPRKT